MKTKKLTQRESETTSLFTTLPRPTVLNPFMTEADII